MDILKEDTKVTVTLFKSFMGVMFGFIRWRVLGNQNTFAITRAQNVVDMYTNPKEVMSSLKYIKGDTNIIVDADRVHTILITKDKVIVIGDLDGSKTDSESNIKI